ncbi:MAG: N-acetylmuramoyl-L-alanine amidase [Lachnospiraceae bacterium]|nr:N-acetylmuramoyl-L-alanine amidase [Lachnospiraceae bacterium]
MLCAGCLLAGKCLRLFSGEPGKDKEKERQELQEGSEQPTQEAADGIFTEEQRAALAGFDAQGKSVVLDAGHGGIDPGKVGVNGANEKEINLKIAGKLKEYLEAVGFSVTMTRTTDEGLYSESDSRKKAADMKARVKIMEDCRPDFAVSIHQNSFTQQSSFGAQVFYFQTSEEGRKMAEQLQATIKQVIADENHRSAKANTSYYLLKKSPCPMVIVECGFLSNPREAELLVTEEYQAKMAWAVCYGLVEYCRQTEKDTQTSANAGR